MPWTVGLTILMENLAGGRRTAGLAVGAGAAATKVIEMRDARTTKARVRPSFIFKENGELDCTYLIRDEFSL